MGAGQRTSTRDTHSPSWAVLRVHRSYMSVFGMNCGWGTTATYVGTWPQWLGGAVLQFLVETMPMNLVNCPRFRMGTPPQNMYCASDRCSPSPVEGIEKCLTCRHVLSIVFVWANDVAREVKKHSWNPLLKPWTVPDWIRSRACGRICDLATSSPVTVLTINVAAPGHLGSAVRAHHTAPN